MASAESASASEAADSDSAATGVRRATTEMAASRGEMELAMSRGVVPTGTWRMDPSGSVMERICALIGLFSWAAGACEAAEPVSVTVMRWAEPCGRSARSRIGKVD